jgi:hypothetical protein
MSQHFFEQLQKLLTGWSQIATGSSVNKANLEATKQAYQQAAPAFAESAAAFVAALEENGIKKGKNAIDQQGYFKKIIDLIQKDISKREGLSGEALAVRDEALLNSLHALTKTEKAAATAAIDEVFNRVFRLFSEAKFAEADTVMEQELRTLLDRTHFRDVTKPLEVMFDFFHNSLHLGKVPEHVVQHAKFLLSQQEQAAAKAGESALARLSEELQAMEQTHRAEFNAREAGLFKELGADGYAKRLIKWRWTGKDAHASEGLTSTLQDFGPKALEGGLEKGLAVAGGTASVGAIILGGVNLKRGLMGYTDPATGEKKDRGDFNHLLVGAAELGGGVAGLLFSVTGRLKHWKPLEAIAR